MAERRFRSMEELERVLFPRLYAERRKNERLEREITECDEALRDCERVHGAVVPAKEADRGE